MKPPSAPELAAIRKALAIVRARAASSSSSPWLLAARLEGIQQRGQAE